jgi:hypothetical protein
VTSATSEWAQGIFSKITFLKSVRSNEKDEVCHSFLVEIFTKSLNRGGVVSSSSYFLFNIEFWSAVGITSFSVRHKSHWIYQTFYNYDQPGETVLFRSTAAAAAAAVQSPSKSSCVCGDINS